MTRVSAHVDTYVDVDVHIEDFATKDLEEELRRRDATAFSDQKKERERLEHLDGLVDDEYLAKAIDCAARGYGDDALYYLVCAIPSLGALERLLSARRAA